MLTLAACQTTKLSDAIPQTLLREFTCDLLTETEVTYLKREWDALSPETRQQAKKNRAVQKLFECVK
jgi:hypothetical protein